MTTAMVLVVDYGMGNLASVKRSLEECGARVVVSDNPGDAKRATKIVLPGVGAFPDGARCLRARGWEEELRRAVLEDGVPILGICLGMQLLADKSCEFEEAAGLGFLPGDVRRLVPDSPTAVIPHVGWNDVQHGECVPLMEGIPCGSDFYFVHSYHVVPKNSENVIATTSYCGSFAAVVMANNIFGTQFHPEKSSRPGLRLLRNFLSV